MLPNSVPRNVLLHVALFLQDSKIILPLGENGRSFTGAKQRGVFSWGPFFLVTVWAEGWPEMAGPRTEAWGGA